MNYNPQNIIIRTSWLYSSFGHNFVKTMIRMANLGKPIQVVDDQIGSPTYAADLAEVIIKLILSPTKKLKEYIIIAMKALVHGMNLLRRYFHI